MLRMVASRLSNYCEAKGILPEEQSGFRRGTFDNRHVVPRATNTRTRTSEENPRVNVLHRPPEMCFIDLQKAYDSVDRKLLWVVHARVGVLEKMLTVIG